MDFTAIILNKKTATSIEENHVAWTDGDLLQKTSTFFPNVEAFHVEELYEGQNRMYTKVIYDLLDQREL